MPKHLKKYKKILLATDLTSGESKLHERALELSQLYLADLTFVHVVPATPSFADMYGYCNTTELAETMLNYAQKAMGKLASKYNLQPRQFGILQGDVNSKLIEFADEIKCDLIIMGAHSKTGLAKFLGSTANGIIQQVDCDVFVVRCPN